MAKWRLALGAAFGVAVVAGASGASATIYGQQYVGTVTGTDTYGLFGVAGAQLDDPYLATFTIDTSKGLTTTHTGAEPGEVSQGGKNVGRSDPVTAVITVTDPATDASKSLSLGQTGYYGIAEEQAGAAGVIEAGVQDQGSGGQNDSFDQEVSNSTSGAGYPSSFSSYLIEVGGDNVEANHFAYQATAGGPVEDLTFAIASATPEPSTWLLMIGGLGGIGLMLRRAKKTTGLRFKDAFAT
jgi:hypothetical protein